MLDPSVVSPHSAGSSLSECSSLETISNVSSYVTIPVLSSEKKPVIGAKLKHLYPPKLELIYLPLGRLLKVPVCLDQDGAYDFRSVKENLLIFKGDYGEYGNIGLKGNTYSQLSFAVDEEQTVVAIYPNGAPSTNYFFINDIIIQHRDVHGQRDPNNKVLVGIKNEIWEDFLNYLQPVTSSNEGKIMNGYNWFSASYDGMIIAEEFYNGIGKAGIAYSRDSKKVLTCLNNSIIGAASVVIRYINGIPIIDEVKFMNIRDTTEINSFERIC